MNSVEASARNADDDANGVAAAEAVACAIVVIQKSQRTLMVFVIRRCCSSADAAVVGIDTMKTGRCLDVGLHLVLRDIQSRIKVESEVKDKTKWRADLGRTITFIEQKVFQPSAFADCIINRLMLKWSYINNECSSFAREEAGKARR